MKKFLHNLFERIKSRRAGRTQTEYRIAWDEENVRLAWLTLENETGTRSFTWDSVLAVDTFKHDHFTVDCICLVFDTTQGRIEVDEDMQGWKEFLAAVESRLADFPPQGEWLPKVMFPAFATNHARLWTKLEDVA